MNNIRHICDILQLCRLPPNIDVNELFTKATQTRLIFIHSILIPSCNEVFINTKLLATTVMNSKTIVRLLLVFSLFASCLPAPGHFLVETEDAGEGGEEVDGGKIDNKQVVGN